LGGVALPESERTKLIDAIDKLRNRNWCVLLGVSLASYADPVEGPPKRTESLTAQRADYVHALLTLYGVPERPNYLQHLLGATELFNKNGNSRNAVVWISFYGWRNEPNCERPMDKSGFRIFSESELKRLERF
jgi:hypothetical protein